MSAVFACDVEFFEQELHYCWGVCGAVCVVGGGGGEGGLGMGIECGFGHFEWRCEFESACEKVWRRLRCCAFLRRLRENDAAVDMQVQDAGVYVAVVMGFADSSGPMSHAEELYRYGVRTTKLLFILYMCVGDVR